MGELIECLFSDMRENSLGIEISILMVSKFSLINGTLVGESFLVELRKS